METIELIPTRVANNNHYSPKESIVIDITDYNNSITKQMERIPDDKPKHFIEANTKEIDLFSLKKDCIIPVFSKDNEVTISHYNFIETAWNTANLFFKNETILEPEIRVSHVIKGRIPEAIYKPTSELFESDKTIYYERMAFCFEIPSISKEIGGNRLNLTIGGVRAYQHTNLYSKKSAEKFKIFIGFKNLVCCNLCISTDGYKSEIKAMNEYDIEKALLNLFQQYNAKEHLEIISTLQDTYLSEHQFAQLIGKIKLYHHLPSSTKKLLPNIEFGDTHINAVTKAYYNDKNFKIKNVEDSINLWKVYNLFTTANKNSYIDNLLDRSLNATDLAIGINKAIHGEDKYKWFIE